MIINKCCDVHVVIREKYGWKAYQSDKVKLWFCGYLDNISIDDMLTRIVHIVSNNLDNNIVLDWVNNIHGHFSFVIEYNSLVISSVDKICSIPLFFSQINNSVTISNHAPYLKNKCGLDCSNLDKQAELEIAMSGYTIGSKTLYAGIDRLESGECLIHYKDLLYRERYYSYSPWKTVAKSKEQLQNDFSDVCLTIFKRIKNSIGDRQIAIPLSAGNDSRLIASGLKEVGVKNVICFSYGRKGNFETPISKSIANKLGYKCIYIEDRIKHKRHFFQSKIYREYVDAFKSFSYTPNVQEVYEVFLLQKTNLVDDEAIIINGSCGDFISGGHIRPTSDVKNALNTVDEISWSKFLDKHYSLWEDLRSPDNDARIIAELNKVLMSRITKSVNYDKYHYAMMESIEYIGRQSKIVIGQQRTYEYFGYEWRMPLWSDEMLSFWESVPYEYKIDQRLYLETLRKNNWGDVWLDIKVNDKIIYPIALRWLRILLKILYIPVGKTKWHRFEKNVLEYFIHPSCALTVTSYLNILFDRRGHRGASSWLSRQMIQSKKE
jgi:asparagine synthase (glutamine-hydrolysing)